MEIDPRVAQAAVAAVRKAAPVSTSPGALATPPAAPAPAKADQAALLAAGAQGGQAGIDAFKQARAQLETLQADALANARSRAAIIGGPEAQGFEKIAGDVYNRNFANLEVLGAANKGYQDANRAAFDKYHKQLKGDMPLLNKYIQGQLDSYRTKAERKKKSSDEWVTSVIGATELGVPAMTEEATKAKTLLDEAKGFYEKQKSGANLKPVQDELARVDGRIKEIEKLTSGGIGSGLRVLGSLLPGGEKALTNDGAVRDLRRELDGLKTKRGELDQQLRAIQAYNGLQMKDAPKRIAELQADYDKKSALTDPITFARTKAAELGIDPLKAAGKLNAKTLAGYDTANDKLAGKAFGEEAMGLASKLNITGGPKRVAEVLAQEDVQAWLDTAREEALERKTTLNEMKAKIGKAYLTKGPDYDPDGYNILIELVARLPWKREG